MGLLVGYGDTRDPRLYPEGLKRGGFELSSVPAGPVKLGPARVARLDSVVDNTEMKGPRDLEELVFPPAPPF